MEHASEQEKVIATLAHTAIVLAGHGVPATDYPSMRVGLLMMLEFAGGRVDRVGFLRKWRERLADDVRTWPRTADNDPYKAAVEDLGAKLSQRLGCRVMAGYNEFCTPTVAEAIDQVIADGARSVVVAPTMLVRGNSHTEMEIHEAVIQSRRRHPGVDIRYAWPFDQDLLVNLLADQVTARLETAREATA